MEWNKKQLFTVLAILIAWRFLQDSRGMPLGLAAGVYGLNLLILIVALTLHEFGHAFVATRLGDPTPRAMGRLTLDPRAHLHPLGTLMILAVSFGFAKPVPINPRYFTRPDRDQILTALAGPGMNLLLCALSILGARWVAAQPAHSYWLFVFFDLSAVLNAILALFNLLPIPPLDGSHLAERLLPPAQRFWFRQNQMMISMVALLLLLTGFLRPFFDMVAMTVRLAYGHGA